jgi:hypothetical protein
MADINQLSGLLNTTPTSPVSRPAEEQATERPREQIRQPAPDRDTRNDNSGQQDRDLRAAQARIERFQNGNERPPASLPRGSIVNVQV